MEENNLRYYEASRAVPEEAKRAIGAGRLKGKTDINPLWRIKKLTEMYGPCGLGWKTTDETYTTEKNEATGEVAVLCTLKLWYKENGDWAAPIFGVGGSMLIALENGYLPDGTKAKVLYLNDEAYKMAHTDALSVACKQLGMGASVYWSADNTKYTGRKQENEDPPKPGVKVTPQTVTKASAPVIMQKTATVYNPHPEIKRIKEKYGVNGEGFKKMRETMIAAGIVRNIPSEQMTEDDWKQLFAAIESNFGDVA